MSVLFTRLLSFALSLPLLFTGYAVPVWGGYGRSDEVYTKAVTEEKLIALTFDDGPHPRYTPEILGILSEYGIKATFFVIGQNAEYHPEIVKKTASLGHEIGNHTYSHLVPEKSSSPAKLISELEKTDAVLKKITGRSPTLFRPPTGFCADCTVSAAKKLGYKIIVWTVDTRDWAHTPVEKIVSTVKENVRSGSIILMHDFISHDSPTPEALRIIIPYLLSEGYAFVTVSELLNADTLSEK